MIFIKRYAILAISILSAGYSFSQSPLTLWYDKPAVKWTEALPIGNGRLGAMIFGGTEQDHIQFNEETLWTGEPRNYARPGAGQYLDTIRQLLFQGKQKEAEALAGEKFMGLLSSEGKRDQWRKDAIALKGMKGNPALENYDDSQWKQMQVPSYDGWEAVGFDGLDGAVWLRTTMDIPADWLQRKLILDLNKIRDQDFTYINGKLVGSMESTEGRRYTIPENVLHAGKNTLAILVLNYTDKGGMAGYKDTTHHIGIYGEGEPASPLLSLNGNWKYFIQNDNPPATPRYEADYQPFGDLWLSFNNAAQVSGYKRELDISNATSTVTYTINNITYIREYLASQPGQVIAIHLTATQKASISFHAKLSSLHKSSAVRKIDPQTIALSLQVKNGALRGESYLRVQAKGGTVAIANDNIDVSKADEVTIYLTAGTNYINYKDVSGDPAAACVDGLKRVAGKTWEQVRAAHSKEYQLYFNTLFIDLGHSDSEKLPTNKRIENFSTGNDPSFVALYLQYGRYLLISASRPGTRPANLQGIWNDQMSPPWGSKYTTNINLEMNYWPAELLNLSPMHTPLFTMISELAQAGKETAKLHYNAPGWVLHHNTDLWRGTAPINASNHGIWVTGGAWLCHHLWEHYLFTQNKTFLKDTAYPLMKQAALFFNSFLIKDPVTGWLISTPSNSPENGGLVAGPTMDHQIIRDLFKNVIAAAEILNTDRSFRDTLQMKYKQIAPNQIGRHGQLQEWLQDKDDITSKHRHVSHLWGEFPGNEINWEETPDLMKAARQSLIYRGDAATGWSLAWKINFWARFKEGDHVYKLIQMLLSPAGGSTNSEMTGTGAGSYPNLFDAHPPFQIDGNFGGASGIGEMLVQSHTKYVDLLPALPAALPDGEIKGICARGGFVLNITWKNGKLLTAEILSNAGKECLLRSGNKEIKFATQKGKRYRFNANLEKI